MTKSKAAPVPTVAQLIESFEASITEGRARVRAAVEDGDVRLTNQMSSRLQQEQLALISVKNWYDAQIKLAEGGSDV